MRTCTVLIGLVFALGSLSGCKKQEEEQAQGEKIRIGGEGIMDEAQVTGEILKRIMEIQRCYGKRLKKDSTLSGRIVVEFTVETSGATSGVKVTENEIGDDAVGRCVTRLVKNLKFSPGPAGGTAVFRYPFQFGKQI